MIHFKEMKDKIVRKQKITKLATIVFLMIVCYYRPSSRGNL